MISVSQVERAVFQSFMTLQSYFSSWSQENNLGYSEIELESRRICKLSLLIPFLIRARRREVESTPPDH